MKLEHATQRAGSVLNNRDPPKLTAGPLIDATAASSLQSDKEINISLRDEEDYPRAGRADSSNTQLLSSVQLFH